MTYDLEIHVSGKPRPTTHFECTEAMAQNVIASYMQDVVDFTIIAKPHIHDHLWYSPDRAGNGALKIQCEDCDESFTISQTLLNACYAGEVMAREDGL